MVALMRMVQIPLLSLVHLIEESQQQTRQRRSRHVLVASSTRRQRAQHGFPRAATVGADFQKSRA